ncbi:MAG: hypothetical protein K5773_06595 [Pseudobutyrivibrio sp.]|nr:hypothetical protein [Pseudobutyrivibrio sp.]
MENEVLHMSRVTYKTEDRVLLQDFELSVLEGEILGILPLNGYGLKAFLELIKENLPLYFGQVFYEKKLVNSWKDMHRITNDITVIEDVSSLVAGQDILSNIYMIGKGSDQYFIREQELEKKLRPFLEDIGFEISPYTKAEALTAFERVMVEILRAVISGHRLIVLHEISSFIGEWQMVRLYEIMNHYVKQGFSFIFISGHVEELKGVCHRTALMSNGKILKILDREEMDRHLLKIYKEGAGNVPLANKIEGTKTISKNQDGPVLEIRNMTGQILQGLELRVARGEYLVIKAKDNRAFEELRRYVLGKSSPKEGAFYLNGKKVDLTQTRDVAVIKERADETMIFPRMSYMDNLMLTADHRIKNLWSSPSIARSIKRELKDELGEHIFEKKVENLSQKNKITLVYYRVLMQRPKVAICILPFKDADIRLRARIMDMHHKLLKKGIAVVTLTMNITDTMLLADRVLELDKNKLTELKIEEGQDYGEKL